MNVLSLFDGISGAKIALDNLGINCNYYASEIDKYPESVSKYHYSDIIRLGDVKKIKAKDLPKIDLLIAGFPCPSFSVSGKRKGFEDPRGKLFFDLLNLIEKLSPRYFLLENVKMKKTWLNEISRMVKADPVFINSAKLTAQNRVRAYWANFPITQPKDRGIVLKDIIEEGITDRDKSYCIDANYFKGGSLKMYLEKCRRQMVFRQSEKRLYPIILPDSKYLVRKLTPIECERLQGIEDDWTKFGINEKGETVTVSNSQRYKMLGNGYTIPVIEHILKEILC